MAKKKATRADRSDPKTNKSLAIRMVLGKLPAAKASEVVDAVKKEYGHAISKNMVYMIKTKTNMAADGRVKKTKMGPKNNPITTSALWVDAIKTARHLLQQTGSVANASALLKALAEK
jgi:hypothetical protein